MGRNRRIKWYSLGALWALMVFDTITKIILKLGDSNALLLFCTCLIILNIDNDRNNESK